MVEKLPYYVCMVLLILTITWDNYALSVILCTWSLTPGMPAIPEGPISTALSIPLSIMSNIAFPCVIHEQFVHWIIWIWLCLSCFDRGLGKVLIASAWGNLHANWIIHWQGEFQWCCTWCLCVMIVTHAVCIYLTLFCCININNNKTRRHWILHRGQCP